MNRGNLNSELKRLVPPNGGRYCHQERPLIPVADNSVSSVASCSKEWFRLRARLAVAGTATLPQIFGLRGRAGLAMFQA